jgi:transglutaminase superfamily protein
MSAVYRRFLALDRSERRAVCEAAALTAFVSIGLRSLRFLTLRRLLDRYASLAAAPHDDAAPAAIACVVRAVQAVVARVPSATCLVQALVADAMLRRRGVASALRFGVRLPGGGATPLEGHAWVECCGDVVVGAAERQAEFEPLLAEEP